MGHFCAALQGLFPVAGLEHLVAEFDFGNLPHHEAERTTRLFADKVMPVLQRDKAFQGEIDPFEGSATGSEERLFAPA